MNGVTAVPQTYSLCSTPRCTPSSIHQRCCSVIPRVPIDKPLCNSNFKLFSSGLQKFPRFNLSCSSTGDNESRTILDAFFLGKAVGEAVSERVESAIGEFLSTVGRLQAEQQKQVQEFQDDILEKARRAKEQAAREALDAQGGIIYKSTAVDVSKVNGFTATTSITTVGSSSVPKLSNEDLLSEMLNDV